MSELMANAVAFAAEINRITCAGGPPSQLVSLWDPLREIMPFSGAWLGVLDGGGGHYLTAAALGHEGVTRTHIESRGYCSDVESSGVLRRGQPVRLRSGDLPSAYASLDQLWWPAGEHYGLGMPLTAPDGRPIGLLVLVTDETGDPGDPDCRLIGEIAPMITAAVDPMTSIIGLAGLVDDARASAVVGPDRAVHPLPGSPAHPLLSSGGQVVAIASDRLKTHSSPTSFLCPYPGQGADDCVRVTAIACPPDPYSPYAELVILSPAGDLHGLTRRELEVLGLVIDGATNRQIAATLFITERTVAAHLEHIRSKLGAPTRTAAAVRSLDQALYFPSQLAGADA
ncbi:LuxR C-terminal-related transcriptional regulator [Paractinoplanes lichenicola]|uniref:GAF domain-containing protein n=1 Tax=Paractinoplanes lichenicola TaxID=2802976 RepID=A0ABS1W0L8_9ACTN|nr:LuxR C-terminal-related transcriptional regulator [Actinoplanes lichenicola]MBL7260276.1 GAF domain-containing protein [Actinoplanes lichenicola]